MEEFVDDDPFCIEPFVELKVMPQGTVRACCAMYPPIRDGSREMSVYDDSVEDI